MNKILRMLMMFGPMIFRQYQKYQRTKAREQSAQNRNPNPNTQQKTGQQAGNQQHNDRNEHT